MEIVVGFTCHTLTMVKKGSNRCRDWTNLTCVHSHHASDCLYWQQPHYHSTDFSVVPFRQDFMLASEGHLMKALKNQWLLTIPSPPAIPCGGTNQGTHHGVWRADAIAVTCDGTIPRDVGLQTLENKALSRGIIRKSSPILAEITIRKSQVFVLVRQLLFRLTKRPHGSF